jgi:sugar phosphate isomerase/epimerase
MELIPRQGAADGTRRDFLVNSLGVMTAAGVASQAGLSRALGGQPAAEDVSTAGRGGRRTRRVGAAAISFRYTLKTWQQQGFAAMKFIEATHAAGGEVAMIYNFMLDPLDEGQLKQLRARADQWDLLLEVHGSDAFRKNFAHTLQQSAAVGVKVVGCYFGMLLRPEKIPTLAAWDEHLARCEARLRELAPIAQRLGITIGIENHLDFTIEELYHLVKKIDSPQIGVLYDVGNGIGTLDDPVEAAELLAPYTVATHYKDFAIEEVTRGFRFTMVPLGCGSLRLPEITARLAPRVRPEAGFSIEMMNGQQFEVKWLEDRFWVPYRDKTARQVAATLRHIRGKAIDIAQCQPEQEIDALPHEAHVKLEFDRVQRCIAHLKGLLENLKSDR